MMQSERVTFLTTPDHKAALDAYAARNGRSVANVLREAATRYMAQDDDSLSRDEEAALALLAAELNEAVPKMQASLERSCKLLEDAHLEMDAFFKAREIAS